MFNNKWQTTPTSLFFNFILPCSNLSIDYEQTCWFSVVSSVKILFLITKMMILNIPRGVLNILVLMAAMFAIRETDDDWNPTVILLWDSLSALPNIHMLWRLLARTGHSVVHEYFFYSKVFPFHSNLLTSIITFSNFIDIYRYYWKEDIGKILLFIAYGNRKSFGSSLMRPRGN